MWRSFPLVAESTSGANVLMENISNAHKFTKRRQIKNRRVGEFQWLLYSRLNHPRTTAPNLHSSAWPDGDLVKKSWRRGRSFVRAGFLAVLRFIHSALECLMENFFSRREEKNHKYICVYTWYICLLLLNSEFILGRLLLGLNYVLVTVTSHECDYRSEISRFLLAARKNFASRSHFSIAERAARTGTEMEMRVRWKSLAREMEKTDFNVNSDLLSSSLLDVTH